MSDVSEKSREEVFLDKLLEKGTLKDKAAEIKEFYCGGYRHEYSKITQYLYREENEHVEGVAQACKKLLNDLHKPENRALLLDDGKSSTNTYEQNKYIRSLEKLLDHVTLEQFRLKQLKAQVEEYNSRLQAVVDADDEKLELLHKRAEETREKLESQELNIVAVLGIFAGIVMAFSGTFSLIGNAVERLDTFNILNVSFTTILLGLILIDAIFVLFLCISQITKRSVGWKHYTAIAVTNALFVIVLFILACRIGA